MNKYACLVVLYNPSFEIVEQLKIYCDTFDKVYLFDNSDKDNNSIGKMIQRNNYVYIRSKKNVGMSGALNEIVKLALKEEFDFLLTMDQDTIFKKEIIKAMKNKIENDEEKNIAIYASNFNKMYIGKYGTEYSNPILPINQDSYVKFHITSGNFIKLKLVKDIYPLDDYFIAFVDFDMDYLIYLNDYKIKVIGDCIISQQIGSPIKSTFLSKFGMTNMGINRFYYLMRNNLYFSKKYRSYKDAKIFAFKKRIIYCCKIILCEKNKIKKIKMMIRGYIDYKNGIMGEMPKNENCRKDC